MKKKTVHRVLRTICFILATLLILAGAELLYSNYTLTVSRYFIHSAKVNGTVRIVFLSDLHGREFGNENRNLLKKISIEDPDLIALVGDVFNTDADSDEIDRMCGFIQKAAEIAPVYFSLGNHEGAYLRTHDVALLECVRQSGATVLEGEYLDVEVNGTPVRIGGNWGYYRQPKMSTSDPELQRQSIAFADSFEATDRFKLLLDHIPTGWLDWHNKDRFPVDLVLSGHYHGGLVRIPILEQGLYAPYVGMYPPYTKGLFEGRQATCVLTTGLTGNKLPRFFNPPEFVVIDVTHQ